MNYLKIYNKTKEKRNYSFAYKGEWFKTFIDCDGDFCITHYSLKYYSNNANSWFVGCDKGLKKRINQIIELEKQNTIIKKLFI
tara:strand:- start:83 stop:331 length:249 start_codon:yes stop_codon:yes gene_type:complete